MENLNERQLEAVKQIDGPLLILAGPGSGKTKTIIERTAYILNQKGVLPENIFLSTFTEKASNELISRISKKIKNSLDISQMYIGTIHSLCHRIIDENLEYSFLEKNYRIFDDLEQRFFIYSKLKHFEKIDGYKEFMIKMEGGNSWQKAGRLQKWIDRINEEKISNTKIFETDNVDMLFLKELNKKYLELLYEENGVDFSNLQLECYNILATNKNILKKYQEKIKYIMIDEYQDTNSIQEKIFFLLAGDRKNICVVGDDDQGLYRFRGATVKNILDFQKNFPEGQCKKIELNINYRSNEDIVKFCNNWLKTIEWNGWRYDKNMISGRIDGGNSLGVVKISYQGSDRKWQEKIYRFLSYLKSTQKIKDFNQVAFLFKSLKDKKAKYLAEYLEEKEIDIYSPRSGKFFERDEIRFVIGLFLCIFHQEKNYQKYDYYNECYEFAKKEIREDLEIRDYIVEKRENIQKILDGDETIELGNILTIFYELFNFESFRKYIDISENHILKNRKTYNLGIFSSLLLKFDTLCKLKSLNSKNYKKTIDYFFENHFNFLQMHNINEYESKDISPSGAVSFLTIHQSKGLEFPFVVIGSLNKGVEIKNTTERQLELEISQEYEPKNRREEFDFFRLFYTGFSRAKNLLALACVENNYVPTPIFKKVYKDLKDIKSEEFNYKDLSFDDVEESKVKKIISFTSHVALFERCPILYKFFRKYEFSRESNFGEFVGTLIHETLEDINKKLKDKNPIDIENIREIYNKNYKNLLKKIDIISNEDYIEYGFESIVDYFKNYKEIYENIKDCEIKVSFIRDEYIIEGIADLVIEKNGELEIIDFKTGKLGKNIEEYKSQLRIYAMLLSEKYQRKIKKAKLFYITEKRENKIIEVPINEDEIENTIKNFDIVAKKIVNNDFEVEYTPKKLCENCILKKYCEKIL